MCNIHGAFVVELFFSTETINSTMSVPGVGNPYFFDMISNQSSCFLSKLKETPVFSPILKFYLAPKWWFLSQIVQPADTKQKDEGAIKLCPPQTVTRFPCLKNFTTVTLTLLLWYLTHQINSRSSSKPKSNFPSSTGYSKERRITKKKKEKKNFTWVLQI